MDRYVVSEVVEKYIYGYPWHLPDGTIRYIWRHTFTGIVGRDYNSMLTYKSWKLIT